MKILGMIQNASPHRNIYAIFERKPDVYTFFGLLNQKQLQCVKANANVIKIEASLSAYFREICHWKMTLVLSLN